MFKRTSIAIGLVLILTFLLAVPAFAGGWAVISLDSLPTGVTAGEPFTVGFTVLQHGRTPMEGLTPYVTASLSGEEVIVRAESDKTPGHYTATMTLPSEGQWRWSIQAFTMDQPMPMLNVVAPVAVASQPEAQVEPVQGSSISVLWIVRALALGVTAIGLIFAVRRPSRLAYALGAFGLLVCIGSFVTGAGLPVRAEAQVESQVQAVSDTSISQVELGRQLFVAKGCITCHVNRKIENSYDYWTIDTGATDLTNFSASPEVLFIRLKDPASAKSDTQMPNLGLKEVEIEALIAFINSK